MASWDWIARLSIDSLEDRIIIPLNKEAQNKKALEIEQKRQIETGLRVTQDIKRWLEEDYSGNPFHFVPKYFEKVEKELRKKKE